MTPLKKILSLFKKKQETESKYDIVYGNGDKEHILLKNVYFHSRLEALNDNDKVYVSKDFKVETGINIVYACINYTVYESLMYVWEVDNKYKGLIVSVDDGIGNAFALKAFNSKRKFI